MGAALGQGVLKAPISRMNTKGGGRRAKVRVGQTEQVENIK